MVDHRVHIQVTQDIKYHNFMLFTNFSQPNSQKNRFIVILVHKKKVVMTEMNIFSKNRIK